MTFTKNIRIISIHNFVAKNLINALNRLFYHNFCLFIKPNNAYAWELIADRDYAYFTTFSSWVIFILSANDTY